MQGSNAKSFVGSSGGNAGRELDLQELDFEELKESYDDDLTRVGDGMGCQATWSLSSPLCSPIHPWWASLNPARSLSFSRCSPIHSWWGSFFYLFFLFLFVPQSTSDKEVWILRVLFFSPLFLFLRSTPRIKKKKVRPFKIQISPSWALAENIRTFLIRGVEQKKREREKITFKIQILPTWASSDLFGESSCWPNLDLERSDFFAQILWWRGWEILELLWTR